MNIKKLFAIILAVLVVFAMASCGKDEETSLGDGQGDGTLVYANLTYQVNDNGTYEITGCTASGTDSVAVSIPSEIDGRDVTGIAPEAFKAMKTLASVTFEAPCNIEYIGDAAFFDCDGLTSIELPDTLVSLGESAFSKCDKLASVKLSAKMTEIPNYAFMYCGALASIELHEGLTTIGAGAFMDCDSLKSVTVPASVTEIGDSAFYSCNSLASVTVLGTALAEEAIGQFIFNDCAANAVFTFEENSGFAKYAIANGYVEASEEDDDTTGDDTTGDDITGDDNTGTTPPTGGDDSGDDPEGGDGEDNNDDNNNNNNNNNNNGGINPDEDKANDNNWTGNG